VRATDLAARTTDVYLGGYDVNRGNAMAFDERRGVMVLFGGFLNSSYNLIMEWDGATWSAVQPVSVTPANNLAYAGVLDSRGYQAFYDSFRGMVACAGGGASNAAIWYWDGHNFYGFDTRIDGTPVGGLLPALGLCFDRERRALVWTGDPLSTTHRTREIRFSDVPVFIQTPGPFAGPVGQTVTLRASVTGPEPLTYRWYYNDQPLLANPRITGLDTPILTIASAQPSDSGDYSLNVTALCGNVSSPKARVAIGPLLNLRLTTTSLVMSWLDPKAAIEQAPTVLGPWKALLNASSPFEIPADKTGEQFFRLNSPGP